MCDGGFRWQYAELLEEGGTRRRVGEDFVFTGQDNIVKFTFRPVDEAKEPSSSQARAKPVTKVERKGGDDGAAAGGGAAQG
jgi:hypothetical protein